MTTPASFMRCLVRSTAIAFLTVSALACAPPPGGGEGEGEGESDCAGFNLDDAAVLDVAETTFLATLDHPRAYEVKLTDGGRTREVSMGFAELGVNYGGTIFFMTQVDAGVEDPALQLNALRDAGYTTLRTIDWEGEAVELIGNDGDVPIAKLWVPREVAEGKRHFPVSLQQQTGPCAEEARALFWDMVATVGPNLTSTFPFNPD